ncbi:MAG: hypothetical protein J0G95_10835 [Rhizobiales bacterium]|nr:hypothetical protein [Hyphomicrobiales bacterium]
MSKTADNLVYEVASILGKAVAGEALGQPEYDTIDGTIDTVLAEVQKIAYVGDRDEIPDEFFQTLAELVAVFAGAKFSNARPDPAQIEYWEERLRYLAANGRNRRTLRIDPAFSVYRRNHYGGYRG